MHIVELHGWNDTVIPTRAIFELRGDEMRVLGYFIFRARGSGQCYPSNKRAAEELGISVGSLKRHIAALEERQFIFREEEPGSNSFTHVFNRPEDWQQYIDKLVGGSPVIQPQSTNDPPLKEDSLKENTMKEKNTSPKGEAPPPKPAKTEKPSIHPAIQAFREMAHRFPAKSWYADIARIVGDDDVSIQKWGQIVKDWVGKGFNPVNVKGMLDVFKNGWEGERPKNGHTPTWADLAADQPDPTPAPPRPTFPGDPIWQTAYGELQLQLPRETFNTWLRNARLIDQRDDTYIVGVDNLHAREWLDTRLRDVVVKALRRIADKEIAVEFVVIDEYEAKDKPKEEIAA